MKMYSQSERNTIRIKHHFILGGATALLVGLIYWWVPGKDKVFLWSMATAYTCLVLFGISLMLGPLNILNNKNNPLSSDLRRDIGIWCGITGIVHIIFGIQRHMGNMWLYFFKAAEGEEKFVPRLNLFGTANYLGLVAGLILLLLLLLSNDFALRRLRPRTWKRLQQFSYLLFVLTLAHSILYQIVEKRIVAIIFAMGLLMAIPLLVQGMGFMAVQRKRKIALNKKER